MGTLVGCDECRGAVPGPARTRCGGTVVDIGALVRLGQCVGGR